MGSNSETPISMVARGRDDCCGAEEDLKCGSKIIWGGITCVCTVAGLSMLISAMALGGCSCAGKCWGDMSLSEKMDCTSYMGGCEKDFDTSNGCPASGTSCSQQTSFVVGTSNTNACPSDSTRIATRSECNCALLDLAKTDTSAFSHSDANYPKGCYWWYGTAWFNTHFTGTDNSAARPICKANAGTITTRRRRGDPNSSFPGTVQQSGTCPAGCTPGGLSAGGFMGLLSMGIIGLVLACIFVCGVCACCCFVKGSSRDTMAMGQPGVAVAVAQPMSTPGVAVIMPPDPTPPNAVYMKNGVWLDENDNPVNPTRT